MYKIYLLLVHTLGNRTIVHCQIDAELVDEFLIVKTFTNLKKRLNVHSGMTEMSRKRLISGFFLALAATHGIKKQDPLK